MEILTDAFYLVIEPTTLLVIVAAAMYGLMVGAIPGLTATMAIALMVPLTFYLNEVAAIAAIVTAVTCSIFAGDIPSALIRIPGTPASAAYANDAYALTGQGKHRLALKLALYASVAGGLLGTVLLVIAARPLAAIATQFTSFEYFWLYVLGLCCAIAVSDRGQARSLFALTLGLLFSTVGLAPDFSVPRLTFGLNELINGISFIPAMIGLFGISEVLRVAVTLPQRRPHSGAPSAQASAQGSVQASTPEATVGAASFVFGRKWALIKSSSIGGVIGMLPGAGADIAAWISYAVSKRSSKHPERYGQGTTEGIADATGANNAALGSAWIPALVFGIPGDSVTAIALGVLMMKNITPGPQIFDFAENAQQATLVVCLYFTFVLANLVLIPLGLLAIRTGGLLVRIPRAILLPAVVLFCIVGSFSIAASYVDVWIMLAFGCLGFALERWGIPLAPIVLGLILGGPLEHRFLQSITVANSPLAFVDSLISVVLAAGCVIVVVLPWWSARSALR
ncbi:MAG TPA: C4-dicarboxylate ABC transporter permease [Planctomycetaceae bacterium]|nr:C4-dicarboxylate ABC transporter permease [Planctomycetaceae bacterium]